MYYVYYCAAIDVSEHNEYFSKMSVSIVWIKKMD